MDLTASPCFDRAEDYGWLVGELRFDPARNAWRLRYASTEEGDRYGGSVTLAGMEPAEDCKDGRFVRVEGRLEDPNVRENPLYRVSSMRVLSQPPWAEPGRNVAGAGPEE